jgi:hypothetical protein
MSEPQECLRGSLVDVYVLWHSNVKAKNYSSGASIIVKLLFFGLAENTFIQATKQKIGQHHF